MPPILGLILGLHLPGHRFVFRTDVCGYYASIDHDRLYEKLERLIPEKPVFRLIWAYLQATALIFWVMRSPAKV